MNSLNRKRLFALLLVEEHSRRRDPAFYRKFLQIQADTQHSDCYVMALKLLEAK